MMDSNLYYEDANVYYDDELWPEVEQLGLELIRDLDSGNTRDVAILTLAFLNKHQLALNITGLGTARQKVADAVTTDMNPDDRQHMADEIGTLLAVSEEAIEHITGSLADFEKRSIISKLTTDNNSTYRVRSAMACIWE